MRLYPILCSSCSSPAARVAADLRAEDADGLEARCLSCDAPGVVSMMGDDEGYRLEFLATEEAT